MKKNVLGLLSVSSLVLTSCVSTARHNELELDRLPAALKCENLFREKTANNNVIDDGSKLVKKITTESKSSNSEAIDLNNRSTFEKINFDLSPENFKNLSLNDQLSAIEKISISSLSMKKDYSVQMTIGEAIKPIQSLTKILQQSSDASLQKAAMQAIVNYNSFILNGKEAGDTLYHQVVSEYLIDIYNVKSLSSENKRLALDLVQKWGQLPHVDLFQPPRADDKISHDQRLKKEVQKLEDIYKRKLTEAESTSVLVTEVATEITELKKNMSWSEKKLWGGLAKLLGGDPKKIDNMKSRETKKKELESLLEKQRSEAGSSNQAVVKYVSDWLKSVDAKFKEVSQLHEKMNELVCDGNSCISKINSALSDAEIATNTERMAQTQIQNAQNTQSGNQPSSNSSMSMLAATHANMARMSSETAQRQAQDFVLSLRTLKVKVEASPYFKVNDNSSAVYNTFVLQSIFNYNFNFIGMVNMFNLNNISSNLHSTKAQVEDMNNQLKDQNSLLKEQVESAICKVRSSCQLDL